MRSRYSPLTQSLEQDEKSKRRSAASKYKEQFLSNWKQKLTDSKKGGKGQGGDGQDLSGNSWEKTAQIIGKTVSDYKGDKDRSRMREAIWNKASDK